MRLIGKAIGWPVSALGFGIVIFGLLAIADPQGAQLANDSDPFGIPPSTTQILLDIAIGVILSAFGIWLVVRSPRLSLEA